MPAIKKTYIHKGEICTIPDNSPTTTAATTGYSRPRIQTMASILSSNDNDTKTTTPNNSASSMNVPRYHPYNRPLVPFGNTTRYDDRTRGVTPSYNYTAQDYHQRQQEQQQRWDQNISLLAARSTTTATANGNTAAATTTTATSTAGSTVAGTEEDDDDMNGRFVPAIRENQDYTGPALPNKWERLNMELLEQVGKLKAYLQIGTIPHNCTKVAWDGTHKEYVYLGKTKGVFTIKSKPCEFAKWDSSRRCYLSIDRKTFIRFHQFFPPTSVSISTTRQN